MKIPDVALRVQLPGEDYTLRFRKLTTAAILTLKLKTGFTVITLANGIDAWEPDALQALVWFCRFLHGVPQTAGVGDVHFELGDLDLEQLAPEPPLDPPTETTLAPGEPTTSESSPTSSDSPQETSTD